jgi:hypothetical protein
VIILLELLGKLVHKRVKLLLLLAILGQGEQSQSLYLELPPGAQSPLERLDPVLPPCERQRHRSPTGLVDLQARHLLG